MPRLSKLYLNPSSLSLAEPTFCCTILLFYGRLDALRLLKKTAMGQIELWTNEFYEEIDPKVPEVGFQRTEPGRLSPRRQIFLTAFDLWYAVEGGGTVKVDGTWHEFSAGTLLSMRPGETYEQDLSGKVNPYEKYWVYILPFGGRHDALKMRLAQEWPRTMDMRHRPQMHHLFRECFEIFHSHPPGYPMALKVRCLQILDIVFAELRSPPPAKRPPAYQKLLNAKDRIEREYAKDLSLDRIAASAEISASYLSALFRRYFACSPVEYLLQCRIREAKLLLARGNSVSSVADAVGFHSLHYFSRMFKKKTGASPTGYPLTRRRR